MFEGIAICSLAVMVASLIVAVYGFIHIFQRAKDGESDVQVIQRQIRGYGLLMLVNIIVILGTGICSGVLRV